MRTQTNLAEHPEAMEGQGEFTEVMPYQEEEEEAIARLPRPERVIPRWPIYLGVSGRYEAYGPILRPVATIPRLPGRAVSTPDGPQPLPTPGPTPAIGEAELEEDPETLLPIPFPFARESLFLDVDGLYPQLTASGTLRSGLWTRVHWIARLVRTRGLNTWSGRIWYKDGNTAAFPYTQVDIQVAHSIYPWQRRATIRFSTFGRAPSRTRTFRFRSRAYRAVDFEFDCAEGTTAVTSVDTHDHPNHPATLPNEQLAINKVFARAGFAVSISTDTPIVPLSLNGADNRWSDLEMHDAMQVYWSRFSNDAQWAMWVFFAALHERGTSLGGIMFDDIGPNHRQGTAIFEDSFINNAPGGDLNPDAFVKRMKFWTACHEMGHAFNLAHSWQKELGVPWTPTLHNEAEARSFMNYPAYVSGGQSSFFSDFEYRFSDQELLFMRHAPERFVQMGNADWFDHHGFQQAEISAEPTYRLELRVNRPKPNFEFLEPLTVELKLTNITMDPQLVPTNLLEDFDRLTFIIKKRRKPARQFIPFAQYCFRSSQIALEPGTSKYGSIFISAGRNGWDLAEPGYYTLQAAIRLNGEDVVSNPLEIRIAPPRGYDEQFIAQDFFSEEVGRILNFNGSNVLDSGNNTLREVTERLSDRTVALYARVALATAKARPCKVLDLGEASGEAVPVHTIQGSFKTIKPDVDEARTQFTTALTADMNASAETLGHINFNSCVRRYTDWLADLGERDDAANIANSLHDVLAERGVLRTVLDDIKRRRDNYKKYSGKS